jgi:type IV pilus assembly protein PilV
MIALVVLSIGLLGIAALYLESLRSGRTALNRTQAVYLASDLGDRMRANRALPDAYACGSPCDPDTGGNAQAITDLTDWVDNIAGTLPEGEGSIEYVAPTATTPTAYVITLNWTEVGYADPLAFALRVEI